ncbi:MAG: hypothetical protein ACXU81_08050 [Myxococcaceae bacterium]
MDPARLRKLLEDVRRGRATVDEATRALVDLPFAELGYATVDTHRSVRFGFPEVVYGEGKSRAQLLGIVEVLVRRKQPVLVTRLSEEKAQPLLERWPKARFHPDARIFHLPQGGPGPAAWRWPVPAPATCRWPRRPRSPPRRWAPPSLASTTWGWPGCTAS